jgi:hypothetical protein
MVPPPARAAPDSAAKSLSLNVLHHPNILLQSPLQSQFLGCLMYFLQTPERIAACQNPLPVAAQMIEVALLQP